MNVRPYQNRQCSESNQIRQYGCQIIGMLTKMACTDQKIRILIWQVMWMSDNQNLDLTGNVDILQTIRILTWQVMWMSDNQNLDLTGNVDVWQSESWLNRQCGCLTIRILTEQMIYMSNNKNLDLSGHV